MTSRFVTHFSMEVVVKSGNVNFGY
jgi:hypothetical protein